MTPKEKHQRLRLMREFPLYSRNCLWIRPKGGRQLVSLKLNRAQQHLHQRAEAQLARTGMVRLIVLKGRQQGVSTYIEGRGYWKTSHRRGFKAFILTHKDDATQNLFGMAERFHTNCPAPLRPQTGHSNAKELRFPGLDSGYSVGTAGSQDVGRSDTIQFFHWSEVAQSKNAESHAAGILQAIPNEPDTEVYLEGTAMGPNNEFHRRCLSAQKGEGDFEFVFIPWFWQVEYRRPDLVTNDFRVAPDEAVLVEQYKLDKPQLAWRRNKIVELGGGQIGLDLFHREYPCTPEEAFMTSVENVVVTPNMVAAACARRRAIDAGEQDAPEDHLRVIWGLDVSDRGGDTSALAKRRGPTLLEPIREWSGLDPMQLVGKVLKEYEDIADAEEIYQGDPTFVSKLPHEICVDEIGVGAGVAPRLRELGLPGRGINVGRTATDDACLRIRDELWWKAREWFEDANCNMPDDPATAMELCTPTYTPTSAGKIQVESKDDLKKRGVKSPNRADAFCLTMAGGVSRIEQHRASGSYVPKRRRRGGASAWAA